MLSVPIDIINIIINDLLSVPDKIYFVSSCKIFLNTCIISHLKSNKIRSLEYPAFNYINDLNIEHNNNIYNISHLTRQN